MFGTKNKKKVNIEGMMCEHCVAKVKGALESIDGAKVKVSFKDKNAITTSKNEIADEVIIEKVASVDKKVVNIENI